MDNKKDFYEGLEIQENIQLLHDIARRDFKGTSVDVYMKDKEEKQKLLEERRKRQKKKRDNSKLSDEVYENDYLREVLEKREIEEEIIQKNQENEQKNQGSFNKGLPPLYKSAELLKGKAKLITDGEGLYYYNGKCYDYLDSVAVIKLYRELVDNTLGGEKSMNNISQLHKFLSTDVDISVKKFKSDRKIVVLNNGIYDVVKEKLKPHKASEIVFSYIDADYVEDGNCRHFDEFLFNVTGGNRKLIKRLWMFIGYIIMQTTEAKVFFVMGEAPDSGKSLLGNFIQSLFTVKYISNIALNAFNKEFSLAPIVGSAVNISLDLPASRLNSMAVSRLKMLTGGDSININQKYMPEFRYENRAKFIFASNSPISIMEEDSAFWNRLVYLPFDKTVPKEKQDNNLSKLFEKEKNVIVSKAIRYAKELIERGFRFPTIPLIDDRMLRWQGKSVPTIERFLDERCLCGMEYQGEILETLYSEYERFCRAIGFVPESRVFFKNFLEGQIGLKHFKMRSGSSNPQSAFRGIYLV